MFGLFKSKKNYNNIGANEFKTKMADSPKPVVIDVRTAAEFKQSAIPGAINMDIMSGDFGRRIAQLDKSKTYLVYCRSGNRSGQACRIMGDAGFTSLYNLSGGIMSYPL